MRNILKLQSGTQSGTPNWYQKMVNFGHFCWGRKNWLVFCAYVFDTKFCIFFKNLEDWEFWKIKEK